jgi:two-component system chemotaxis sensor kinase CheA
MCGFLGFAKLESVAHMGENLLSRLRDGLLLLNPEITSALLALMDAVRDMLARIESTGQEGRGDYAELIATLARLQEATTEPLSVPQPGPPAALPMAGVSEVPGELPDGKVDASGEVEAVKPSSVLHTRDGQGPGGTPADEPSASEPNTEQLTAVSQAPKAQQELSSTGLSESSIRVDVGLLAKADAGYCFAL